MFILLFIVVFSLSIGYSYLNTGLNITGHANIKDNRWDIYFDNIQIESGSQEATSEPVITNNTTVTYGVTLNNPGEYYEFNIDIVNNGTIDAVLEDISIEPILTTAQREYLNYQVKYTTDEEIDIGDVLTANTTKTIKVIFEYKDIVDTTKYSEEDQDFDISIELLYSQY